MAQLVLSFLGSLQITLDGEPLTAFRSDKERALLAFLALEAARPHRREALIGLLWPEQPETLAFNNLRKSLARLRQTIRDQEATPPFLLITPKTIQFNPNSDYRLDAAEFATLLDACRQHRHRRMATCAACNRSLRQAADLYCGDLLHGFFLADCVTFDEWLLVRREWLRRQALEALSPLTEFYTRRGEYALAQRYALQQIAFERWHEPAYRQLMRALALGGERTQALAHYAVCRQVLAEELGVEPEAETKELYESIISSSWHDQPPASNLKPLTTPFIGREGELARLCERLLDPAQRLVTLVGEGGVGKTWLAVKAAASVVGDFADGAWFVSLAGLLGDGVGIPETIATAIGFTFYGKSEPKTQLLNYLRGRECLLVLDNFEQVLAGADLVMEILDAAPKVVILATSREPLKFQAERVMRLEGLPVPPSVYEADAEHYTSVRLFVDRAERSAGEFALTAQNALAVIDICQLIDGLPLGIVLAASQIYARSPAAVARAIRENADALAVSMRDLPPRQRSIRAVFEWSWDLLTPNEQAVLARVSVFRGGFTKVAAQAVAGAAPAELQSLVDKSLIRQAETGRYDVHELWRQIASDKLAAQERQDSFDRHSRFFMTYAGDQAAPLNGLQPRAAMMEMQVEIDNLREAWHWALANKQYAALIAGLDGLADFYDVSGFVIEGVREVKAAINAIVPATPAQANQTLCRLSARLWAKLARFSYLHYAAEQTVEAAKQSVLWAQAAEAPDVEARARVCWCLGLWRLADFAAARAQANAALALATQCRDAALQAESYSVLGFVADSLGRCDEARSLEMEALDRFRAAHNARSQGLVLICLGNIAWGQGDLIASIDFQTQALHLSQQTGNRFDEQDALNNIGNALLSLGDYEQAQTYFQRSRDVARAAGLPEYATSTPTNNLAFVLHHLGNNDAARHESLHALNLARQAGMRREEGVALNCLGHALAGLNRAAEATQTYQLALNLQRELGQHNLAMEPLAGLARVALAQRDLVAARQNVEEILRHLETGNLEGTDEPFRVYLTCYRVLQAHGDPRAPAILHLAQELLQARARAISDEHLRCSFLENVPAHRELVSELHH